MTDNEALIKIEQLLATEVPNPGPTWLAVIDVCLWAKQAAKRIPPPKRPRKEYMRDYMRTYMRNRRVKQAQFATHQPPDKVT